MFWSFHRTGQGSTSAELEADVVEMAAPDLLVDDAESPRDRLEGWQKVIYCTVHYYILYCTFVMLLSLSQWKILRISRDVSSGAASLNFRLSPCSQSSVLQTCMCETELNIGFLEQLHPGAGYLFQP